LRSPRLGFAVDLREYRQCAEVLFDSGLCQVRLMSNNPLKLRALEEAGLTVVKRVALEVELTDAAVSTTCARRRRSSATSSEG